MAEELTLDQPKQIGDLENSFTVSRLRVAAVSFNRQKGHEAQGTVILAVLLEDPVTGWPLSVTYEGAEALSYARFINTADFTAKSLHTRILEKLQADGKIPPGAIAGIPD